jgi:hypothetical protein
MIWEPITDGTVGALGIPRLFSFQEKQAAEISGLTRG